MALWAEAYKPDAMIFLMSPNSEPLDAAMAVKLVASKSPNLNSMGVNIPITVLAPKQSIDLSR